MPFTVKIIADFKTNFGRFFLAVFNVYFGQKDSYGAQKWPLLSGCLLLSFYEVSNIFERQKAGNGVVVEFVLPNTAPGHFFRSRCPLEKFSALCIGERQHQLKIARLFHCVFFGSLVTCEKKPSRERRSAIGLDAQIRGRYTGPPHHMLHVRMW